MHTVGDVANRNFILRPVREERGEQLSADFAMQTTHAIHRATPANGQIGHVESFRSVVGIPTSKAQQSIACYAEFLLGIASEVLPDQRGIEAVETGRNSRMGGEDISGARGGERNFKGLTSFLHEIAGPFEHGEGRMPFIQM